MADRVAQNRRLLRARDAMDRDFALPLDVASLAAIACISESNFIRSFKSTFGETPHRYLQRRRIERAMFLLRTTDRSVTDVCLMCSFSSLGTFSRTFSDIIGESPSAFRARTARGEPPGFQRAEPPENGQRLEPLADPPPLQTMSPVAVVPTCFVRTWARPAHTVTSRAPKSSSFGEAGSGRARVR